MVPLSWNCARSRIVCVFRFPVGSLGRAVAGAGARPSPHGPARSRRSPFSSHRSCRHFARLFLLGAMVSLDATYGRSLHIRTMPQKGPESWGEERAAGALTLFRRSSSSSRHELPALWRGASVAAPPARMAKWMEQLIFSPPPAITNSSLPQKATSRICASGSWSISP